VFTQGAGGDNVSVGSTAGGGMVVITRAGARIIETLGKSERVRIRVVTSVWSCSATG
jgi:hypothetical protein